jgi:hypothetical protein
MCLFHASTCFEQQALIIRKTSLCQYIMWYNTLWWVGVWRADQEETGPVGRVSSWPARQTFTHQSVIPDDVLTNVGRPDDEHLLLETCRGMRNRASSWFINQNYVEMHGQHDIKNVREIWSSQGGGHKVYFLLKKYRLAACLVCPKISEESLASLINVEETCTLKMDQILKNFVA